MLVRKCFPNFRKANQKRNWKLKKLDMEEAEPGRKTNQAKEDAEYEQFMMDLEEDEDMRTRVNIYRDKDAKEMVVGGDVEADAPIIPLEEMLEDLNLDGDMEGGGMDMDMDMDGSSEGDL